jgi:dynactin 1
VLEGATENERMLLGQCERLKEALMKLRDISVVEKQEHEKKLAEVTKRAEEVGRLEGSFICAFVHDLALTRVYLEKIQRMEAELQKRLKEIEELKTQLDELADAQRMVEELTEKNLNLEEYMEEQKVWYWLLACLT